MKIHSQQDLKILLDEAYEMYHTTTFVEDDPIQIPHQYTLKQDIEITAFWTSMLAWGQRKTIINKSKLLFEMMDNAPYDFLIHHQEDDLKVFESFKHRTFQATDTLYFIAFLSHYYKNNDSLETAFISKNGNMKTALTQFHELFFSLNFAPQRTRKHVATPARNSACKRLNMFLRWMVRKDELGVDFGIWNQIKTKDLMIPLDVHVRRVASSLGLLKRKQNDFKAVEELTNNLKKFDANDPVKYDFALFGLGLNKAFIF